MWELVHLQDRSIDKLSSLDEEELNVSNQIISAVQLLITDELENMISNIMLPLNQLTCKQVNTDLQKHLQRDLFCADKEHNRTLCNEIRLRNLIRSEQSSPSNFLHWTDNEAKEELNKKYGINRVASFWEFYLR